MTDMLEWFERECRVRAVSFSLGDGVVGVELIMVEGLQLNVKPNDLRVVGPGAATSARLLVVVYVSLHLPPAHISNLNLVLQQFRSCF
jgi:hypothetical protein